MNLTKIQVPSTSVKFQWSSGVVHVKISLLRWRINCCICVLPQPKKRHNASRAYLDFGGNISLLRLCSSGLFTEWYGKLLVLGRSKRKRRLCNRSRLLGELLFHCILRSSRSNGAGSVNGRQRQVNLCTCRLWGFGSKALRSSVGN